MTWSRATTQNYAVDIYQEYFSGEYVDHSSEAPSAKTLSVLKDPSEVKRTVSNISWYPDGGKKLAVAFAIMVPGCAHGASAGVFNIWDVNNPNTPELQLTPASPLCSLEYNPKDPHFLVGGSYNGPSRASTRAQARRQRRRASLRIAPLFSVQDGWLQGKHPFGGINVHGWVGIVVGCAQIERAV